MVQCQWQVGDLRQEVGAFGQTVADATAERENVKTAYYHYGQYSEDEGWRINCQCHRDLAKLQIYNLLNCLRAGDRPAECVPNPPAGRTLVEFSAAAWTPFHPRFFKDSSFPGHHREPEWLKFTKSLETLISKGRSEPLDALTEKVYHKLVEKPLAKFLEAEKAWWADERPFGSFVYDYHDDYVAMHIYNVYMPDSLFNYTNDSFQMLKLIMDDIQKKQYSVQRIGVDSWINWLEPFKALFPASYAKSFVETTPDNKGGNGWWGQYIRRTGELNEKRAQVLRETRKFDYTRVHAECLYKDFCEHVEANLKNV
jgi:hypothetical protein